MKQQPKKSAEEDPTADQKYTLGYVHIFCAEFCDVPNTPLVIVVVTVSKV